MGIKLLSAYISPLTNVASLWFGRFLLEDAIPIWQYSKKRGGFAFTGDSGFLLSHFVYRH